MNAALEEWRPVVGWEDLYEVSDQGRVMSVRTGRILRLTTHSPSGYQVVGLCGHGQKIIRHVHRLVLDAFVGPLPHGLVSCHNNGFPADNRLSNLRYDTPSSNNFDKVRHGRDHNASKTHCHRGHEFVPENIIVMHGGSRKCRTCARASSRDYMRRIRTERRNLEKENAR